MENTNISIEPSSGLIFCETKISKMPIAFMKINNNSDYVIAYTIKSTNPNDYIVTPNFGILEPLSTCAIRLLFKNVVLFH